MKFDVIVVGAGPAGCAAAIHLSRKGCRVLVLERAQQPQHKTCGDGLLPDALKVLADLGVGEQVRGAGLCLAECEVTAPGGRTLRLKLPSVTLQRQNLHHILQQEALRCGTELMTGEAVAPLVENEQVVGVSARFERRSPVSIRAPLTILASGARVGTLRDFGVCLQSVPSAVGIRGYFRDLTGELSDALHISYDRDLQSGYGWVFPLPEGIFNIGCGWFFRRPGQTQPDLNRLFEYFLRSFPPARAVACQDVMLGLPCGGVLRTGMVGARSHRAGLLVAGEALGSTLPFTGEGVGKALETGLLAGRFAGEAFETGDFSDTSMAPYSKELAVRYHPVYREFQRAQNWLATPALIDLLVWQASRRPIFREAVEEMLSGGVTPGTVISLKGLLGRPGRAFRKRREPNG